MSKSKSQKSYIDRVEEYFVKFPDLSNSGKSAIVSILPWLSLIFGTLGIAISLVGLGIFTVFEPIAQITGIRGAGQSFFYVMISLVSSILLLSAYPGIQKKKEEGWRRIYYSRVLVLLNNIIALSVGGVALSLIGFYILYQIRIYYK